MRIIAATAIIATAAAVKIQAQGSELDALIDDIMWNWDWDMDGELSEDEFINLVTYLDEDQYLTDEEYNYAIQQFQWADPTSAIWLTDTLSSTSAGEDYWEDLDLDEFVTFGEKLGGDDDELEAMFYNADWDGSGDLDIWEQDSVWYDLME